VSVLLKVGADVEARDAGGMRPLLCAVERGHAAVVRQLLDRGADVRAAQRSEEGNAAFVEQSCLVSRSGQTRAAFFLCPKQLV
jgi:ankyrin repeat protein